MSKRTKTQTNGNCQLETKNRQTQTGAFGNIQQKVVLTETQTTVIKAFGAIRIALRETFGLDAMNSIRAATPYTDFQGFAYSHIKANIPAGLDHLASTTQFGGETFSLLFLPCEVAGKRSGSVCFSLASSQPKDFQHLADFIAFCQEIVLPQFLKDNPRVFTSEVVVKTKDISEWEPRYERFSRNRYGTTVQQQEKVF